MEHLQNFLTTDEVTLVAEEDLDDEVIEEDLDEDAVTLDLDNEVAEEQEDTDEDAIESLHLVLRSDENTVEE